MSRLIKHVLLLFLRFRCVCFHWFCWLVCLFACFLAGWHKHYFKDFYKMCWLNGDVSQNRTFYIWIQSKRWIQVFFVLTFSSISQRINHHECVRWIEFEGTVGHLSCRYLSVSCRKVGCSSPSSASTLPLLYIKDPLSLGHKLSSDSFIMDIISTITVKLFVWKIILST